jgi:hypothetical protein
MPKVTLVKKSRVPRKDSYTGVNIPVGSSYYTWAFRYGGPRYSLTSPKQSQLTNSPFLQALYGLQEEIGDLNAEDVSQEKIDEFVSALEDMRDEVQGSLDNMPEGLQEGDTGQMMQERIDSCESAIDELTSIDAEVDEAGIRSEVEGDTDVTEANREEVIAEKIAERKQEILDELQAVSIDAS